MGDGMAELLNQFASGQPADQASNYSTAPSGGTFTYAMLCETLDKIYNAPVRYHGSGDDPHLYHPNPKAFYHRYCATCGMPREWLSKGASVADIEYLPRRSGC
jgi:hypothetical protein